VRHTSCDRLELEDAVPFRVPIGRSTSVPEIPRGILYLFLHIIAPSFGEVVILLIAADTCEFGPLLCVKVHSVEVFLQVLQMYALHQSARTS